MTSSGFLLVCAFFVFETGTRLNIHGELSGQLMRCSIDRQQQCLPGQEQDWRGESALLGSSESAEQALFQGIYTKSE